MEELVNEFTTHGRDAGYLACMIAILYFLTIYGLEKLGASTIWKPSIRGLLADYAYPVGFSFFFYITSCNTQVVLCPLVFLVTIFLIRIAYTPWFNGLLIYLAGNTFLGRICTLSRQPEINAYRLPTCHPGFLSYARPRLVDPFLAS